jgi:hypothetical protein
VPLLLECLRLAAVDCCKNLSSFDAADPQGFCSEVLENDESSYADLRFLRLAKTLRSVWITAPASKGPSFEQNAVEMSDIPSAAGDSRTGGDSRTSGDTKSTDVTAPTESALSSVVGEDSLWSLLSSCLTTIESQHTALSKATSSTSSISPALSRLQPLVEAYFVVHAPLNAVSGSGSNSEQPGAVYRSRSGSAPEVTSSSPAASSEVAAVMTRGRSGLASEASPRVEQWIEFAEKHRNALNSYLRQVSRMHYMLRLATEVPAWGRTRRCCNPRPPLQAWLPIQSCWTLTIRRRISGRSSRGGMRATVMAH